ncbi:uncharacterized protein I303_104520 [Kwoniella dejecticola CBS 10117]|uniref:Uncharacterized protein n=1 Tax=Kwoniella dejecticola CBS 10117 TaxID=1296121 RepID=A0A1A6A538_9TREE|nr:uncharacterized protein I303_04503 [Kwoniella dejecticola CBS 10117]OBR85171.1 hypothetical protein I303_04503 [Kwoniella dejecticola CBS 10117]
MNANYASDSSSSYSTPSPSSTFRTFSDDQAPSPLPQYTLSSDFAHLVDQPGMNVVIARKVAKLQDSLPNLSQSNLRQAKADMMYLLSILGGEDMDAAQSRAGTVFNAPL